MKDDLISRSALWTDMQMLPHNGDMISSEEMEQTIKEAPAVDVETVFEAVGLVKEAFEMAKADLVPVVRCKDCQHTGITGRPPFMFRYCRHPKGLTAGMRETDFCPYGERRADE